MHLRPQLIAFDLKMAPSQHALPKSVCKEASKTSGEDDRESGDLAVGVQQSGRRPPRGLSSTARPQAPRLVSRALLMS